MENTNAEKLSFTDAVGDFWSNDTSISQKTIKKIQFLIIDVDSRLELIETNAKVTRDLLGRLSHLVEGVDLDDFCCQDGDNDDLTPVDVQARGGCSC